MSLKQIDLLLYVWLLINAIGWFGFLALPRLRKSLSCKEKADGIVEDIVETQNTKGQPLFHAVVRYQAGLASYAFLSWVLMCPGHPRDPEEDMEQMRYLSEQIRKRAARKKSKKTVFQDEQ